MGMEAILLEITASYQGEAIPTILKPELPMPMVRLGILGIFYCSWKSHKRIKIASWRP
jgi:hypothetical protein